VARHGPPGPRRSRPRTDRDRRRRTFGQNFLVDDRVAARIVALAAVTAGDLVVDLGAGRGALTGALLDRGATVRAVELDPVVAAALRDDLRAHLDVEVVVGDCLEVALPAAPFRVVANPPFGITTALLRRLLGGQVPLRDATLLLQRDTARRVSGSPTVGRFSLTWAPWYELAVHDRVDARAFRPIPRTDAAITTVRPRAVPWLSPARYAGWSAFVDAVFDAPGRTAAERLVATLGRRTADRVRRTADVDVGRPPSRVPAEAWVTLYRSLPGERSA
jgi:23S rRNA (adenine-N6)-dimethyltransferase